MKEEAPDTHHDHSANTHFGFWLYLMTDCVLFAVLFATYLVLQTGTAGGPTPKSLFSLPYALTETLVLLTSSFTCGLAMVGAGRGSRHTLLTWFAITFLLGATFLGLELAEFGRFIGMHFTWERSAFLSAYFTLIGTHGLHVAIGLIMMIIFTVQVYLWGFNDLVMRRLSCLKLFWHFLYLIWIFEFIMVYLTGVG